MAESGVRSSWVISFMLGKAGTEQQKRSVHRVISHYFNTVERRHDTKEAKKAHERLVKIAREL